MAESEKTDKTDNKLTVADLKKYVGETVAEVVKSLNLGSNDKPSEKDKPEDKSGGKSVAEQVQEALARIKSDNDRATREKTIDDKLTELSERTKEKPPVERRRVHKFMGWGE